MKEARSEEEQSEKENGRTQRKRNAIDAGLDSLTRDGDDGGGGEADDEAGSNSTETTRLIHFVAKRRRKISVYFLC